jgi:hypothetical protein
LATETEIDKYYGSKIIKDESGIEESNYII